jgi:uncharacterized protein HemY
MHACASGPCNTMARLKPSLLRQQQTEDGCGPPVSALAVALGVLACKRDHWSSAQECV